MVKNKKNRPNERRHRAVLRVPIVEAWIAVQDVQESQRASFPRRSNSVTSSVDAATPRSRRRFAQNPHKDERVPKMPRVCDCRNLLESLTLSAGWEAGIRTPIPWSRATCPTVGRPPSARGSARRLRELLIIAESESAPASARAPGALVDDRRDRRKWVYGSCSSLTGGVLSFPIIQSLPVLPAAASRGASPGCCDCSCLRRWLAIPPLRPASRASSLVHSWAVPF